MNWDNMPKMIRELRIAYMVPEIRGIVLKKTGLTVVRWIATAVAIPFLMIPLSISLLADLIGKIAEIAESLIGWVSFPAASIHEIEIEMKEKAHKIVKPAEIRERAFGEFQPKICAKEE